MGGSWIHLKFESDSITERDFAAFFVSYEAYIGMIYKVPAANISAVYINGNQRTHLPRHGYTGESGIGYEGRGRQENAVRAVRIGS